MKARQFAYTFNTNPTALSLNTIAIMRITVEKSLLNYFSQIFL